MIALDGSYGEGGGALLRTALALSVYTNKSFEVTNIRANRPKPGLKAQHLAAIEALGQMCNAKTNEVELGSTHLRFIPGPIKRGKYEIDIGTAGSITLVLQSLLLPCCFAPGPITLEIRGGTCGKWQASVDYLQQVLLPHLQRFADIDLKIRKRGYFPRGGGEIQVKINPRGETPLGIQPFSLKDSQIQQVRGLINAHYSLGEVEVGERMQRAVRRGLAELHVPVSIRLEYVRAKSVGGELLLWAIGHQELGGPVYLGADRLFEPRKTAEVIAREATTQLKADIHFGADVCLADQLIPFMGLLPGSEITTREISDHTLTNIHIIEQFLPVKFTCETHRIAVNAR